MPTQGVFQSRTLERRVRQVLRRRLRMLPFFGGNLIPTITDLQPGVRELVQDQVLEFGEAELGSPDSEDIPLVEIQARENRFRVFMPRAGYPLKYAEVLANQVAAANGQQYNPTQVRETAVIRVIEEQVNKVIAAGSTALGLTGVLNNAGVSVINSSFDPFDAGSTADDIADWFLGLIGDIFKDSNNVEYPNTALVSTSLHELMARRRMPDGDKTVLAYVMETQSSRSQLLPGQRLTNIVPLVECGSDFLEANGVESSATNKDRIVLYPRDQEVIQKHMMTGAIAAYPDDWTINKGSQKIYPMYSFCSEVIINFPGALRYIKHDKEA